MVFWPLTGIFGVFSRFTHFYRTKHHYDIYFFCVYLTFIAVYWYEFDTINI